MRYLVSGTGTFTWEKQVEAENEEMLEKMFDSWERHPEELELFPENIVQLIDVYVDEWQ